MTEKLFYKDQYIEKFRANVLSCEKKNKEFYVILDKSAFYPEGGGQPGDSGYIGEARVTDTVEIDGNQIHICDREVTGECECKIDRDKRFLYMQLHSAEHIFSGILHGLTGFDNVGFHIGKNYEVTVDFNGAVSDEILMLAEEKTNDKIFENVEIKEVFPREEEIEKLNFRSKKEINSKLRLIEIPGADLCACCGTHVKYTGEIGLLKVLSCYNYKQGVRITLAIGKKALYDYREKCENVTQISVSLCAKTGEVAQAVEKLKEKHNDTRIELNNTKRELFETKCESVKADFPVVFDGASNADNARILADMLAQSKKIGIAFSGDDEKGYKYAVVSLSEDVREIGKKINSLLDGKGGAKPEMAMGNVKATRAQIEKVIKEII